MGIKSDIQRLERVTGANGPECATCQAVAQKIKTAGPNIRLSEDRTPCGSCGRPMPQLCLMGSYDAPNDIEVPISLLPIIELIYGGSDGGKDELRKAA